MIETSPLLHRVPFEEQKPGSNQRWEIDHDTIRRLRDVIDPPSTERSSLQDEGPANVAIANWFHGPTGLIDIASDGMPLVQSSFPDDIVDVSLDATLSLHRSLDLIASDNSRPFAEDIRGAILAAIAAEQSAVASPIHEPLSTKSSSLAYSGAALFASTLVIVGRRKRVRASDDIDTSR